MNIDEIIGRRKVRPTPDLLRHVRKCCICRHPRREDIEFDFLTWRNPREITAEYGLAHHSAIYRHAHATGLASRRLENVHHVLDYLIEKVESAPVTGNTILRAMRAYTCIDSRGRWTDPPRRIIHETHRQTDTPNENHPQNPAQRKTPPPQG
jgi:hypothetical protein